MIDLASFFTIQTPGQPLNSPHIGGGKGGLDSQLAALKLIAANQGEAADKEGEDSEGGFSIFDLLLTTIEDSIANGDQPITADEFQALESSVSLLQSDNPLLEENPKLDLIKILAGNDKIAEEIEGLDEIVGLELIEKVEHTLALNQQVFDNIIEAGTGNDDLQIDKETGEIIVPDVAKTLNLVNIRNGDVTGNINRILEKLDLNTINLTPEQVTQLQEIQAGVVPTEVQAQEVQETLQTILSGIIGIVTPQALRSDIVVPPQALKAAGKPASLELAKNAPVTPANDVASRLNGFTNSDVPLPFSAGEGTDGEADFDVLLTKATSKAGVTASSNGSADITPNVVSNANNAAPQPSFNVLQAWPFAATGSLLGSSAFSDQIAEQLGLSLTGQQSIAQGSLTALVSQSQSAAQSHPATQMVAASISKSAISGETNLSLRLDPPDLGRVDVRMTFGKDKTVKAVVTAEKPETYIMLQRDAQTLERALQDAGLDADGGLSFELAEHGFDFEQNNHRGGGHDNGGTGSGDDGEEIEILESTMTWSVDPETGHTRYDIWA